MNFETERKFLVRDDSYKEFVTKSHSIIQGYIAREEGNTVRIRIRDGVGILTIKGRTADNGLSRPEWEMEIPYGDAAELLELCKRGRIEKIRHIIPAGGGLKWEVDEFLGGNAGLVVAEIELPTPETPFERPEWLSIEVTGAKQFYNSYLSAHPYTSWK